MSIIRAILAKAAGCNFIIYIQHIAGINNSIADSLSRMQMERFRALAPLAARHPTRLPPIAELY